MMMMLRLFVLLLLVLVCSILPTTTASSTTSNYNPIHYDRLRHFTPDGRLLQVEYAMRASENSSPLVVCQLNDDTLVLMSCQQQQSQAQSTPASSSSSAGAAGRISTKPQDRMVIMDNDNGGGSGAMVLAMSGVLADSIALLRTANQQWLDWKTIRGEENTNTQIMMHIVSKAIAEQCHANSFMQGIRPFGASLLLVGVIPSGGSNGNSKFQILQTDASGAIAEISVSSKSSSESGGNNIGLIKILGGSPMIVKKIEKALEKLNDGSANNQSGSDEQAPNSLWGKLRSLTKIVMESQQDDPPPSSSGSGSFFKRITKRSSKEDDKKKPQTQLQPLQLQSKLEVVLVSRKLGIHRLPEEQVQTLVDPEEVSV